MLSVARNARVVRAHRDKSYATVAYSWRLKLPLAFATASRRLSSHRNEIESFCSANSKRLLANNLYSRDLKINPHSNTAFFNRAGPLCKPNREVLLNRAVVWRVYHNSGTRTKGVVRNSLGESSRRSLPQLSSF